MTRLRELLAVEGRTLIAVALAVVLVEAAFRVVGDRLSGDVTHMNSMDEIVETLNRSQGLRLLVVGNSLIGAALDPGALTATLSDSVGVPVAVGVIRPDGGSPLEWYYLMDRYVFDTGRVPDLLILPFDPGHLFDRPGREAVLRLAAHHVAADQIPELLINDMPELETRVQFMLARVSRLFGLRDRVQPRVMDWLVPDYRALAYLILHPTEVGASSDTERGRSSKASPVAQESPGGGTLDQIQRLQRRADSEGLPVLYVVMPEEELFEVSPKVRDFLLGRWPGLLDFRADLALPPERFYDGQHMDADGRQRFTDRLAAEILPTVRRLIGPAGG